MKTIISLAEETAKQHSQQADAALQEADGFNRVAKTFKLMEAMCDGISRKAI